MTNYIKTTPASDPRATVEQRAVITHVCKYPGCGGIVEKRGNNPGTCTRCKRPQDAK